VYAVISAPPGYAMGPAMIAAIDTSSYAVAQTFNLPSGVNPGIPALSADDGYLYVPNNASAGGVLVIDTQNPSSITTIPTSVTYPKLTEAAAVAQVAVTPDGELLFAWGSNNFFVIDITTGQQIGQILLPTEQGGQFLQNQQETGASYFVIDPTGSRIYAFANYGSGPSNTWTGYLYVYDTASLALVQSVELSKNVDLDSIAITPDGSAVFVGSFVYADGDSPTFGIDTQSLSVTQANSTAPPLSQSDTGLWQTLQAVLQ
jgi:DNA-binding beta-propeller fold protein YncE